MRRHSRITLDVEAWPDLDRRLWQRAFEAGGLFDPPGPAAHWRWKTRRQVAKDYGLWLFHVARQADPEATPSARVTEARLRSFIQAMEQRGWASTTITTRFCNLREALRIMEPGVNLELISHVLARLRRLEVPSRNKAARIVHPRRILQAALGFLDTLADLPCNNEVIRGTWCRDGLILAVLATAPIRLQNLADLDLNRHMERIDGTWHLRFPPEETKERRRFEITLPQQLDPYISHYLVEHRPRLLRGRSSTRLWISLRATPVTPQAIYCSICHLTERLLGQRLNPHLFRDCLATAMATEAPEHMLAAARLLGHTDLQTTESYYNQAEQLAAVRSYHEALCAIRVARVAEEETA